MQRGIYSEVSQVGIISPYGSIAWLLHPYGAASSQGAGPWLHDVPIESHSGMLMIASEETNFVHEMSPPTALSLVGEAMGSR